MQPATGQFLDFDGFRLDVSDRKLTKNGEIVALPPKAFDLLAILVSRGGHLLEKDAIMAALWPDTFVEEANLANYVSHLRKALGKAKDRRDYIETVPKIGYRFRVPATVGDGHSEPTIRSVAVLPFVDLDANAENGPFRDGLTEELINELAQIGRLEVIARTTVWRFRDQAVDLRDAAQSMHVDGVIEGSVRQHAGRLRISVQLIRSSDGCHAWSKTYDRDCGDPLSVEREVSHTIAIELRARFFSGPEFSPAVPPSRGEAPIRMIVLPFRQLRPDQETEFLSRSLAEAIAGDLSCLNSLLLRSSLVAERFSSPAPDLYELASVAHVDVILTGTLVRSGTSLRFSVQLIEAPEGAVRWSMASEVAAENFLGLRDEIVKGAVSALQLELTTDEKRRLSRSTPITCRAYEFFLRANEIMRRRTVENVVVARDLYRECLTEDPDYAPAWARLGRCYRFLSKFADQDNDLTAMAQQALQRALAIQPELAVARNVYTLLQADLGCAREAMVDLMRLAHTSANDPELYAGLVHACRFCGELDASLRAHDKAHGLDPNVITSVEHTVFLLGNYERALAIYSKRSAFYMDAAALVVLGREREAAEALRARQKTNVSFGPVQALMDSLRAILEGDRAGAIQFVERALPAAKRLRELEGAFYMARHFAYLGELETARDLLSWLNTNGFCIAVPLRVDPWLEKVRKAPGFDELRDAAMRLEEENHSAFVEAGGPRLLGTRL